MRKKVEKRIEIEEKKMARVGNNKMERARKRNERQKQENLGNKSSMNGQKFNDVKYMGSSVLK